MYWVFFVKKPVWGLWCQNSEARNVSRDPINLDAKKNFSIKYPEGEMKSRNVPRDPINLDAKKRSVSMKYPEGGFFVY